MSTSSIRAEGVPSTTAGSHEGNKATSLSPYRQVPSSCVLKTLAVRQQQRRTSVAPDGGRRRLVHFGAVIVSTG